MRVTQSLKKHDTRTLLAFNHSGGQINPIVTIKTYKKQIKTIKSKKYNNNNDIPQKVITNQLKILT